MNAVESPRTDILTVDVEDWFHILEVDGLDSAYGRTAWSGLESRVARNTDRLLELFAEVGAQATFFVVGWVAEREPALIRRIAEAGHEVACHSYWHEVVARHTPASLAEDLGRAKELLEDATGDAVAGFRAPGGSITLETLWALDVVAEAGFSYDSSVWPAGTSSHGGLDCPFRGPHRIRTQVGELDEIPASTFGLGRWQVPYAGGGYLRLFPYGLIRMGMRMDGRAGRPTNIYVHPREIDPDQPRMELPPLRRFKYYVGLHSTEAKLRRLLAHTRFVSAGTWLAQNRMKLVDRVFDVRTGVRGASADASAPAPQAGV